MQEYEDNLEEYNNYMNMIGNVLGVEEDSPQQVPHNPEPKKGGM